MPVFLTQWDKASLGCVVVTGSCVQITRTKIWLNSVTLTPLDYGVSRDTLSVYVKRQLICWSLLKGITHWHS